MVRKSKKSKTPTAQALFRQASENLHRSFEGIRKSYPDPGEAGFETEEALKEFLNLHMPKRFRAESGYIIDKNDFVSPQIDVIVYDALNCSPYRVDKKNFYIPNDNVAAVVETTYRLDEEKIKKDLDTMARVKELYKEPLSEKDKKLHRLEYVTALTLGVIFAFDTPRKIETVVNYWSKNHDDSKIELQPDFIVIHNKGMVGRFVHDPETGGVGPLIGAHPVSLARTPMIKISLGHSVFGQDTLYIFFSILMGQLQFFRPIMHQPKFRFHEFADRHGVVIKRRVDWQKKYLLEA